MPTESISRPLARLFGLAGGLARQLRVLGVVAALAGVWVAYLLIRPISIHSWSVIIPVGVTLALFAAPGGAVLLLSWALGDLARVPERTGSLARAARERSAAVRRIGSVEGSVHSAWLVGRSLYDVWALMLESRELLFGASALVRMANPVSLLMAIAVTAVALLVTVIGALSAVVVLLGLLL